MVCANFGKADCTCGQGPGFSLEVYAINGEVLYVSPGVLCDVC